MDREREREYGRGYTERIGGGQSYRPGERPRRSRSPPNTYSNEPYRPNVPRSRSPRSFDGRPPRRFDSPARINPAASTYRPGPVPRSPAGEDRRRTNSRSRSRSPRRRWSPRRRSRSRDGNDARPTSPRRRSPERTGDWRNRSPRRSTSPGSRASPMIHSGSTSRRASPPMHPSRMHLQAKHEPPTGPAVRSPLPYSDKARYGSREPSETYPPSGRGRGWNQEPPTGPRQPTEPSARGVPPPTGPAAATVVKRASINVLSAPTQPRGIPPSGPSASYKRPKPHPAPIQTQTSTFSSSPSPRTALPSTSPSMTPGQIPTGPRATQSWGWRGNQAPPARNARFGPPIIPGGKLLPSLVPPAVQDRLKKLESERELIERELKERLEVKRRTMWEWQRLESEVTNARYRSELAEQQLTEIGF